jgi:hypothetical protein
MVYTYQQINFNIAQPRALSDDFKALSNRSSPCYFVSAVLSMSTFALVRPVLEVPPSSELALCLAAQIHW